LVAALTNETSRLTILCKTTCLANPGRPSANEETQLPCPGSAPKPRPAAEKVWRIHTAETGAAQFGDIQGDGGMAQAPHQINRPGKRCTDEECAVQKEYIRAPQLHSRVRSAGSSPASRRTSLAQRWWRKGRPSTAVWWRRTPRPRYPSGTDHAEDAGAVPRLRLGTQGSPNLFQSLSRKTTSMWVTFSSLLRLITRVTL
jgi:hypothetical protein